MHRAKRQRPSSPQSSAESNGSAAVEAVGGPRGTALDKADGSVHETAREAGDTAHTTDYGTADAGTDTNDNGAADTRTSRVNGTAEPRKATHETERGFEADGMAHGMANGNGQAEAEAGTIASKEAVHERESGFEVSADLRVLVVGAGGLGCEILKNLVSSGFMNVDVIDMDVVELSNLNRQFLFTEASIGRPKAEIAAERASLFAPKARITAHVRRIEDMPDSFYTQFHFVVSGLDSVRARRWLNAKLVDLCLSDPSPSGLRPLIDGGSEGFRGQARVILPGITACYECTLALLLSGTAASYPLCTLASTPRLPEHCIEWAKLVRWPQHFDREPDFDSIEDVQWLCDVAHARAAEFDIAGVSLELTFGVLKRIVPAVATTNAVVAASCCIEALKLATGRDLLDNYFMYAGDAGVFSSVLALERRRDCPVCGSMAGSLTVSPHTLLERVLSQLQAQLHCTSQLPSISTALGKPLYMANPPSLRAQLEPNLRAAVSSLLNSGDEVAVTHADLAFPVRISILFA